MTSISIRYFAWVRELIGAETEELPLDAPTTLAALLETLRARSPGHARALAEPARLRAAINEEFTGWSAEVRPGDAVALFPPMTGG